MIEIFFTFWSICFSMSTSWATAPSTSPALEPQISTSAQTNESLGVFQWKRFELSPSLQLQENNKKSGFVIKNSLLGLSWNYSPEYLTFFAIGSSDLVAPAVWFRPDPYSSSPQIQWVEAWISSRSYYGDFKWGLISIGQTFEGVRAPSESIFPYSKVWRQNWFIKRDLGVQYEIKSETLKTQLTLHNGESGVNQDGKIWFSANWFFFPSISHSFLLSASSGETRPESTNTSIAAMDYRFHWDRTQASKIRYGALSYFWHEPNFQSLMEWGRGDLFQGSEVGRWAWGRWDIQYAGGGSARITRGWSLLFRYEQSQSNLEDDLTIEKSSGIGLSYQEKGQLSAWTILATHNEESPAVFNEEFEIVFKMNSAMFNK